MQRVGFSIADSWTKAGFKVNARQVDNGEFNTVQNTNSLLQRHGQLVDQLRLQHQLRQQLAQHSGRQPQAGRLDRADHRQLDRITDQTMFDLIAKAKTMDQAPSRVPGPTA